MTIVGRRAKVMAKVAPFVLLAGLAACTPPVPPMVTLDDRACTPAPDFTAARPLPLSANAAPNNAATVVFDQNSPCWQTADGKKRTYAIFTLPDSPAPFLIGVTSLLQGQALFAPHLYMFDGLGRPLRDMPRDSFLFHGSALYLGIRAYPNERYLMIASETDKVGAQESQLRDGTNASAAGGGGLYVSIHTGFETDRNYTYAVNGTVNVVASPVPKAN
jgi:hypothetical protein